MKKFICACGENQKENFNPNRRTICKNCIKQKSRSKYQMMSDEEKKLYKDKQRKWGVDNPFRLRFLAIKNRSKTYNIELNFDDSYIEELYKKQEGKCFYSGLDMTFERDGKYIMSVDRVDANKGYVKDNIVLCCSIINSMKNTLSTEEFLSIIKVLYLKNFKKLIPEIPEKISIKKP